VARPQGWAVVCGCTRARCTLWMWGECKADTALRAAGAQGLAYQMQLGAAAHAQTDAYLVPRLPQHEYGPPLAGATCCVRLLQAHSAVQRERAA
jgi:hypothetical protein